jgi:hypothetical protein
MIPRAASTSGHMATFAATRRDGEDTGKPRWHTFRKDSYWVRSNGRAAHPKCRWLPKIVVVQSVHSQIFQMAALGAGLARDISHSERLDWL